MKERPIIFSAPMVRAIQEDRKTQTRRVVKWPIKTKSDGAKTRLFPRNDDRNIDEINRLLQQRSRCPFRKIITTYGQPGDLLWVRESVSLIPDRDSFGEVLLKYAADEEVRPLPSDNCDGLVKWINGRWSRPSIHMPKWAARIWLEVTGIRVERLQEITEEDAVAEGARWRDFGKCGSGYPLWGWSMEDPFPDSHALCLPSARMAFANFINKLHGGKNWNLKPSNIWESNPWVWVVEFKKLELSAA